MNFRTTLVLLFLVAAGAAFWLVSAYAPLAALLPARPVAADEGTRALLENELTPEKLRSIRIQAGEQFVLERTPGGDWTLPGKWPTRKAEVDALVRVLCNLRSRFAPFHLNEESDVKDYGLDSPKVTVQVGTGGREYKLSFGERQDASSRASPITYLRLEEKPEVLRLAPGLVSLLDRPQDYYQQRRLFPSERVAREDESAEKVERLAARSLEVKDRSAGYRLVSEKDEWQLQQPQREPVDPDKLRGILAAVPDVWAEQFVSKPKKDLAEYGLKNPEQTIRVTSRAGNTVTLLVGKQSRVTTRTVMRPAPNMGGPPMPPQREVVHDEFRYAKLQDNDQIFDIKADKLKDLLVSADNLRDARLARFRADEARRLEIRSGGVEILLAREKDQWRLLKPFAADAESSKINELLDKLAALEARDKDVLYKADVKTYGLDKPSATIQVTVEQEIKGQTDAKSKKTRSFTFSVGKHDAAKVYVRVAGWDRVNAVDDGILKLAERPALAYRSRRVLDFAAADVTRLDIHRHSESLALEQVKGSWYLAGPVRVEIDASRASQLAGDLSRLEAVEYVTEQSANQDLEKQYGLARTALTVTVAFADAKKPAQTLQVGKARNGNSEFYAKLATAPAVFVVKKEIRDALDRDSLAYRNLQLWQAAEADVQEVRLLKDQAEYRLQREAKGWQIGGPFIAPASADLVQPLLVELTAPRCDRYAAHAAKDLKAYGLDQPELRVVCRLTAPQPAVEGSKPSEKKTSKTPSSEHVLLIGKKTDPASNNRFGKLSDGEAVFVVGDKLVAAVNHRALDFLDRNLLALDTRNVESIIAAGAEGTLVLQRKGDEWRVEGSPGPPFAADSDAIAAVLGLWSNLRAQEFAAYGPKVDLAAFGLDRPFRTISLKLKPQPSSGPASASPGHTLRLGKGVPGHPAERYARLDDGPGVAVLAANVVSELTHGYLDFVARGVLKFDRAALRDLERRMGKETLKVTSSDGQWRITQPGDQAADGPMLDSLIGQLAGLRAKRVAAYPAKDLQAFGLDQPDALVTLQLADGNGKKSEHLIRIGKRAGDKSSPEDRFARVDDAAAVVVLPGNLAEKLTASALEFRNHDLASITNVDRVTLVRESRTATFTKTDGNWRLAQPVEADAEQTDLEDFVSAIGRLRADRLIAEKPSDLKPYGLDYPRVRWQFFVSGKLALDLAVGKAEQKAPSPPTSLSHSGGEGGVGSRCFARLADRDLVFLLSPQLTTKVLGEYRSRSLWTSLDAVQVDKLSYRYAEQPFVLEKVNAEWQLAGEPNRKVRSEVIRETLDALASLRAERYLEDQSADLKLYGLDPPQLALEIQTASGNRTLHLGRHQAESGRYYARIPEAGKTAVFVISQAEAARIVRRKEAYIKR
jgi:hypothetical protein